MADPLALYTSVMGRLWEDERIRGQAAARIDARLAGRRQGRSFTRVGSLSARNALKAASGQSRAAVFKRIRAGRLQDACLAQGANLLHQRQGRLHLLDDDQRPDRCGGAF